MNYEPAKEERAAINSLKRLAKRWPKTLWLFADGDLNVMRCGADGKRAYTPLVHRGMAPGEGGRVDPDYLVDTVALPSDGGDW